MFFCLILGQQAVDFSIFRFSFRFLACTSFDQIRALSIGLN